MGKDKACNDIINTAKNNINFSYCHTKYFYSYNIKYNIKSFTKYFVKLFQGYPYL